LPPESPRPEHPGDLYERDYAAWLFHNAALIRAGRFAEVDIANVAEELEDMGRSETRAVGSHIAAILMHLLKWQFQPQQRSSGWRGSAYNARRAFERLLEESPSLRRRVPDLVTSRYRDARYNAVNETGLPEAVLPEDCPYTPEQVLDDGFWPGGES
jgi:hypothetical protein